MKHVVAILLLLTSFHLQAQKVKLPSGKTPPPPLTAAQIKLEKSNHACVHRNKINAVNRMKKFPFSKAAHIRYVSFIYTSEIDPEHHGLPMSHGAVRYEKLNEVVSLSRLQVDSLTDVIYNVGFKGQTLKEEDMGCYEPRNAILFTDSTNKLIGWIEICFECEHTKASSEKISLGDFCNDKYEMIKRLMQNAGIRYGTIDDQPK